MNNLMGIIRQSAPSLGAEPYGQAANLGYRSGASAQRSAGARRLSDGTGAAGGTTPADVDGVGAAQSATTSGTASAAASSALANKDTFLTLLVAQIRNQNPLNPADGVEFLTQLAQFTQLEQLISIREELERVTQLPGQPDPTATVPNGE